MEMILHLNKLLSFSVERKTCHVTSIKGHVTSPIESRRLKSLGQNFTTTVAFSGQGRHTAGLRENFIQRNQDTVERCPE